MRTQFQTELSRVIREEPHLTRMRNNEVKTI